MGRKGFTLLEVLVGIVLFAVAVVGLSKMQVINTKGSVSDKNALTAIMLAEKRIEELRGIAFDSLASSDEAGVVEQGMTTTWTVGAATGPDPQSEYRNISVIVTWTETWQGQNITRRIDLATVVSEV